ncbi:MULTISPECIES: branched-chain amino acid ABC transporter ATP-binding protein/permease [unclassified Bosea (in: a-proteobacteria)]|uniref:branched-chain amino acid ABC transporter ATP-binding protein/permease n=1 Tax=unclassified Bosea (in: a-proteobacteria) TaxID=2653178 RepID=UPI000F75C9EE|nr:MULTISPECIES: branched-chain amino acid ABC transporter ATP-binding protein/permease [unclassified Bosea (in: a-proteobacteria)]AZO77240.1 ABC transporter ATP-binding protein [Bosea sp. Tri-49]RXT22092.1 ABC transporter ATP-binding protein [Bosea sp. Tri-39]RXT32434.1 ABC transporter ATP-binding protein [Bosea sp. Tri-54]
MPALAHAIGVALLVAGLALVPYLGFNDFYLQILFTIGVNYLAAAGLNVLVGYAGQKSLGHAGLFAVGAYTAAIANIEWGLSPWLSLLLACGFGAVFGLVIAMPSVRVSGPSLAMVTIGFGIVVEKIVTEWTDIFKGQAGFYGISAPSLAGTSFTNLHWVWFVAALCIATHLMLRSLLAGRYGRAFLAVQMAEPAAQSVGISVVRAKTLAFVISAVTCALAGAVVAQQNQYFNSDFITFNLSIFLLVVVIFGGSGSLYGPLFGAVILTLLDAWLARWPALQHFSYGALLLFSLYLMPNGIAGAVSGLAARWRQRKAVAPDVPGHSALAATSAAAAGGEILIVKDLYKAYGGIVPVRNVSFAITAGKVHALIGPNGAGKTTLLNLLSGHVAPDGGSIRFEGRETVGFPAHRVAGLGIARTFQNLKLFGDLSALDNVLLGAHRHIDTGFAASLLGLPSSRQAETTARADALALLTDLGLGERANEPANSLPYGLQRRLEIARALASRPKLLLLDEPAAGLNPQETHELGEVIRRIREAGVTVLLIEHHMDLVMDISQYVLVLDYGALIAEGRPEAIRQNPKVIVAYLGADEDAIATGDAA